MHKTTKHGTYLLEGPTTRLQSSALRDACTKQRNTGRTCSRAQQPVCRARRYGMHAQNNETRDVPARGPNNPSAELGATGCMHKTTKHGTYLLEGPTTRLQSSA